MKVKLLPLKHYFHTIELNEFPLLWVTESERENHIRKLNNPLLSAEICNSTSNYTGSLPDNMACIQNDYPNNSFNCTVCILFKQ